MDKKWRNDSSIVLRRIVISLGAIFFAFGIIAINEYRPPEGNSIGRAPFDHADPTSGEDSVSSATAPNLPYGWTSAPRKVDPAQVALPRISSTESMNPYRNLFEIPGSMRADDAATFSIGKNQYLVTGIRPVPLRMVCTNPDGKRWSCGQHGRMALRSLIAGKTLQCLPFEQNGSTTPIDCRLSDTSLAAVIVGAGWAAPTEPVSDALGKALAKVQAEKAGAWASLEGFPP